MNKVLYSYVISFNDEYYFDGVNIFDNNNKFFIKKINILLPIFKTIDEVDLFLIKGKSKKFKIVIKRINDFYIVGFLNKRNLRLSCYNKENTQESIRKNQELLINMAIKEEVKSNDCIYSKKGNIRAKVLKLSNSIKVDYQHLVVDEFMFLNSKNDAFLNPNNIFPKTFCFWKNCFKSSFFDDLNEGKEQIINTLENL